MAFTNEQLMAINTEGNNIIVSAGAGSGKTAVLTERVIHKLMNGIDIDHLLVLTFTNEAASEMRGRIRKAIVKNKLDKQLSLIDSAYITTFDSFALSLVKKYHYLLNIPKNVNIIDSGVITIYKYKLLDKIFSNMYGNPSFDNLINDFCLKDDKPIKRFILEVSNKLDLLVDKNEYLNSYSNNFNSLEFYETIKKDYLSLLEDKINEVKNTYDQFINYANDTLIKKLDEYYKPLFNGKNYHDYLLIKTMPNVRYNGVDATGLDLKEELKNKTNEVIDMLRFDSEEEITESIKSNDNNTSVIINILKEIIEKTDKYKEERNVYEFNDIAHMAIKIVKDNILVRKELKEYFNEIMIDEYQDTSDIQEEFINYIANNNVYMVGDIKQAIYRFRNANPYNFFNKYENYSKSNGGIKIDLLKNFRSRKETLDNINEIFNLVMDIDLGNADYITNHNMIYGNTLYDNEDSLHNNKMDIYNYEINKPDLFTKEEKEAFIVAEDIINKIDNGYLVFDKNTNKLRKLKYSDICIITDRNTYLNLYRKILEYKGIPTMVYMDSILNNDTVFMIVRNLIDLVIHVNDNIYDKKFSYLFTSIARSNLFEYDDNKIYQILTKKEYYNDEIVSICRTIDMNSPMIEIVNEMIDKFDIYNKLIKLNNINENIIAIDNIIKLADNLNSTGYNIRDLITYLNDMEELELPIKYKVGKNSADAVKIMNIHMSKGLEFSLCYFLGMYNEFPFKEVKSKFVFDNKYGIILPYIKNNELINTPLKDLYVNNYYKEEISEKIRLFYVALTRAREKMIILTNMDEFLHGYNRLVPYQKRIKYRSFQDILNSIDITRKYIINKSANYTKDYNLIKMKDITLRNDIKEIQVRKININKEKKDNKRLSKSINKLMDINSIKAMEYGTKVHEIFEYDDFYNPKSKYVNDLLKHIDNNFINVYHEHEFKYINKSEEINGIIDLILEYDDKIYIVDYKLKDISDMEYIKQLNGYKHYLEKITDKKIQTFLYSVIDNLFKEVSDE